MCIVRKAAPHKCHGLQGPVQSPPSTPKSSSMYVERALTQRSKCTTRASQVFTICWVWTLQCPPLPDEGAGECWGGTSTGEDGNRTGHKSPPWEAWTRPASLLSLYHTQQDRGKTHRTKEQEVQEGHGVPVILQRQQDSEAHTGTGDKILQWFQPSFARRSWAFFPFDAYDWGPETH